MAHKAIVVTPSLSTSVWAADPTAIVLHATAGGTGRSSVDHLRSVGLSYHFIIARDGKDTAKTSNADGSDPIVYFCTDLGNRAAHVGSNVIFPDSGNRIANRCAIGIALANRQNGEAYTPKQLTVLDEIVKICLKRWPSIKHLTTHAVIQPWNRRDPLNINGKDVATAHGLKWFEPSPAVTHAANPGKQGKK